MKKLLFFLLVLTHFQTQLFAGGGGCTTAPSTIPGGCSAADPFCTGTTYTFPNTTGTGDAGGLDCLLTTPNPTWYYLQIATAGDLSITINQTNSGGTGIDVDYAMLGPYTSVAAGCSDPASGCIQSCSYDPAAQETATITGAQVGEIYLLLLTNYADQPGTITFNQTGGTGATDCSILSVPCAITGLTAVPSACNPANNQYSTSGTVTFSNPPTTGTLTVTSSCGGSQTFNAPFGTTANYNLTGLNSTGAGCTVTASFSATACSATVNFTAPAACLPCNMTGITTNVGACAPATNTYAVSGNISFTNAPASGTLTITGSCGGTQTYNAPFTSPAAYNFTGLTSNGAPCTISAVFSAAPSCTISQNYTAPASCIPPCNMATLNATIGSCLPDNTFTVTGTFSYQNAPATGTVVVTVTNSSGSSTQTFNPPFVNNQIYNFSIPGNNSNGSALTVTVAFSNAPACLLTVSSTSPAACGCTADIGTFTATTTGPGTANYVLCFGDEIDITANGNYTPPAPANNPPLLEGYEPGITWLVYSCPPTIAVTPSDVPPNDFIGNDPCLIGLYSDFDMYDINDQFWMTNFPGVFTNNIVYFVPITMYNLTEAIYSYVNTTIDCYEMGAPFAVQYLTDITFTQAQTCTNVTATISGGLPALNGSQFTGSNLTPANASFVNTTANNGGTIAITGLTPGQAYSFQVTDANGCPKTISGTFVGGPTLSYPQAAYCPVGTASPTITGIAGGTYSSTVGLSINTSTGIINLAASTPNTYTVTYTSPASPGPACPTTFVLTINPLPTIVANNVTVCQGGTISVNATGASTYTWSPATYLSASTGASVNFVNGITTNYTVTGTDANGCINTDPVTVTVNGNAPINAGPDLFICIGASTTLTASGGVTYSWNNGLGTGNNFSVSPTITTTYTVSGTDANGCLGTDAMTVTINPLPTPIINGALTYCLGTTAAIGTTAAFTSYNWSTGGTTQNIAVTDADNPITVTVTDVNGCVATSPIFTVSENNVITYNTTVTICQGQSATIHGLVETIAGVYSNTTVLPTGCDSVSNVTLIVNPLPSVGAGIDQTVCAGASVTLNGSGASTYTWSGAITNNTSFTPAATNTYTVTGTDANGCVNTDDVVVTVNPIALVNAGLDQNVCAGTAVTLTGSGSTSYSWNNGVSNGVAFTPAVGTLTYTVIGTSLGCTSTDQVVVTVSPLPNVFAGTNVSVCEGETVTLTVSGASTYSWNPVISNGIAFVPTLGTTTYTVTGTSTAGCINTDQVDVIVNPIPVVSFTPDVTIGCAPLTVNLTNTTTNSTDCVWSINNGTVLTGCGTVPVTFTQGGCYDVTLTTTSNNGCVGTLTSTDLICVEALPIASFDPSSNVLSTLNTEVLFTNTSTGATSYLWNFGDVSQTSNVTNPTNIYPGEPGTYQVMLVAYSPLGCTDTAYTSIIIYEELIFYIPNTFTPDDDNFNPIFQPVFTAGFDPYDFTLLIFNRWGEIIFESHDASIGWNGTYGSNGEIEMCQDGTYTWKIEFKTNKNDERKMVVGHVNLIR